MKTTSTMTGRERILAAIRRQDVDYVPCAPFMNPQDWCQRVGRRWQYPFGPSFEETIEYLVRVLGVDQAVPHAIAQVVGPGVSARVWREGDVIHKAWQTPAGTLHAAVRHTEAWPHGFDVPFFSDYNPAHFVEPWIKTHADVACMAHVLRVPSSADELEAARFAFDGARRIAAAYAMPLRVASGMGLTAALTVFGPAELCELTLTDPGLVEEFLELEHGLTMRLTALALDLGADIIQRNGFYETTDFFSPAQLEAFLGRRLAAEIRIVHEAGRVIGYTALSGITPMLPHLAKLDFDCLVSPDFYFKGMDAVAAREALGSRTSFWTGPSDTFHLPYDDPAAVRDAVRTTFSTFGRRGLLLTPCSSSKAVFPWSGIEAMVDEWRRLR